MDYGYPQSTEARILREYITQEGYRMEAAPRPPTALTNAVSWRSEGIKHRKNEIFLDVVRFSNHRNRVISFNVSGRKTQPFGIKHWNRSPL